MSKNIKKILIVIVVLGAVVMSFIMWQIYQIAFVENTAFENREAHIYIRTGSTFQDVATDLEPLLKNIKSFEKLAYQKQYVDNIKSGHFIIQKGMTNNDIITILRSKNIPVRVKFNNQERLENLAGVISKQIEADSLSLLQTMLDDNFLEETGLNKENALTLYIPNTYEFYWNTSAEGFRERMKSENERFWNENRKEKAKNINLTKEEVISLAAIVQKETAMVDERARVAGVYINRLKIGMLLQADPTIIYAIKKEENDFNQQIKRVLYSDLEIDSPYNTYKYPGIPPGPIAMPDISSIDAVLNPEKHDYLYFVADVEDFGYHKFSKTLAQHNVNKQAYIRWLNSQGLNKRIPSKASSQ